MAGQQDSRTLERTLDVLAAVRDYRRAREAAREAGLDASLALADTGHGTGPYVAPDDRLERSHPLVHAAEAARVAARTASAHAAALGDRLARCVRCHGTVSVRYMDEHGACGQECRGSEV